MAGVRLDDNEREDIRAGIELGESLTGIAVGLGRVPSTVSRELERSGGREPYSATTAARRAAQRARRPKRCKLADDMVLRLKVRESWLSGR